MTSFTHTFNINDKIRMAGRSVPADAIALWSTASMNLASVIAAGSGSTAALGFDRLA